MFSNYLHSLIDVFRLYWREKEKNLKKNYKWERGHDIVDGFVEDWESSSRLCYTDTDCGVQYIDMANLKRVGILLWTVSDI